MSKRWLVVVVLFAAAVFVGYFRPWAEKPIEVAVEIATSGPISQILAVNGRVAARNSVTVRAPVSAKALELHVDEGDVVKAGDVLVSLDMAIVQAQVDEATAALEGQRSKQRQAEVTVARARALGANSPRSALEDAELALESAITETARLEAVLEQAKEQASQYLIRAPISGVVLTRGVDLGQLVDTQSELFVIADTSELIVETDVDELYSAHMSEGLKAQLLPIGVSVPLDGTVTFTAPKVDPSTGGRKIKIAFDSDGTLPIGLTVNANVIIKEFDAALSLPRSAIASEGRETYVMVLGDRIVEKRVVQFADWPSERVIVTEGLGEGDSVILDPARVKPGVKATAG